MNTTAVLAFFLEWMFCCCSNELMNDHQLFKFVVLPMIYGTDVEVSICMYVCVCEKAKEILVKMKKHFGFFFLFLLLLFSRCCQTSARNCRGRRRKKKLVGKKSNLDARARSLPFRNMWEVNKRLLLILSRSFFLSLSRYWHRKTKDQTRLVQQAILSDEFFFLC